MDSDAETEEVEEGKEDDSSAEEDSGSRVQQPQMHTLITVVPEAHGK